MRYIFVWAICLALIGACAPRLETSESESTPRDIENILGIYKQWILLTPTARNISVSLWQLCRAPTPQENAFLESEHGSRYLRIYVNEAGAAALAQAGERLFPTGSIVVKEKLVAAEDVSPASIGIMIKREPGFNPGGGDWEYVYRDERGNVYRGLKQLANCQSCHAAQVIPSEWGQEYESVGLLVSRQARDSVFLTLPAPDK